MREAVWLWLAVAGCGFDDFEKLAGGDSASGPSLATTEDTLENSSDTGFTGGGSGSTDVPCTDDDLDGFDTCSGDCDDADPLTFPGAAQAEEDDSACMRDQDNDGWGDQNVSGSVQAGQDCNDADPLQHPEDWDRDGFSPCDGDCDDSDSRRAPGLEERPNDGLDSDCDGEDGGFTTSAVGGGGTSYPIRDYQTTESIATIASCPAIWDVTVRVDISHSFIGDLTVTVFTPSGTSVVLHRESGGSADNINGTYSTSSGTLTPAEYIGSLLGEDGTGDWRLQVHDSTGNDEGYLSYWSVELLCV